MRIRSCPNMYSISPAKMPGSPAAVPKSCQNRLVATVAELASAVLDASANVCWSRDICIKIAGRIKSSCRRGGSSGCGGCCQGQSCAQGSKQVRLLTVRILSDQRHTHASEGGLRAEEDEDFILGGDTEAKVGRVHGQSTTKRDREGGGVDAESCSQGEGKEWLAAVGVNKQTAGCQDTLVSNLEGRSLRNEGSENGILAIEAEVLESTLVVLGIAVDTNNKVVGVNGNDSERGGGGLGSGGDGSSGAGERRNGGCGGLFSCRGGLEGGGGLLGGGGGGGLLSCGGGGGLLSCGGGGGLLSCGGGGCLFSSGGGGLSCGCAFNRSLAAGA